MSWAFFEDEALTVPAGAGVTLVDGAGAVDRIIYLGDPAGDTDLRAASAPGIDPVSVEIHDAAAGTGIAATAVRLALTAAGLAGATPGAALAMGATLDGAIPHAIHVRTTQGALAVGVYTDLVLRTVPCVEV